MAYLVLVLPSHLNGFGIFRRPKMEQASGPFCSFLVLVLTIFSTRRAATPGTKNQSEGRERGKATIPTSRTDKTGNDARIPQTRKGPLLFLVPDGPADCKLNNKQNTDTVVQAIPYLWVSDVVPVLSIVVGLLGRPEACSCLSDV
jgi:hypothetical protein